MRYTIPQEMDYDYLNDLIASGYQRLEYGEQPFSSTTIRLVSNLAASQKTDHLVAQAVRMRKHRSGNFLQGLNGHGQ